MAWKLSVLGVVLSVLLLLLLAAKWKLLRISAAVSAVTISILVALPFLWIYPLCGSGMGLILAVLGQIALALVLALGLLMWRFWRDPERTPPSESGLVLSPADGVISCVTKVDAGSTPLVSKGGIDYCLDELTGASSLPGYAHLIGVEMSYLDVHVNRCPINGKVTLVKHIKGGFISLRRKESPFVNARCTTVIENRSLTVAVVQIASRLVRRVESYLGLEATVDSGQRLGIIRFGSLVAVVLPQRGDVKIKVKPGDLVKAGVSILARYQENVLEGPE